MKKVFTFILLSTLSYNMYAQSTGAIEGRIVNKQNNEPVPFANIVIWETNIGSTSDFDGNFLFAGLEPGYVEIRVSAVGFKPYVSSQIMVTNARTAFYEVELEETSVELEGVTVKASPFRRSEESPVSLQRIGIAEIEKNPGGNRDISRVIQSLPGVGSTPAFRNDVIVRGGGPGENTFYLDGVEIPNLNHFATQGASGGPVGIINADFIREANFYSSAFPSSKGNSLSAVLDFRQINGNSERIKYKAAVGASDLALTLDGPLSDRTTAIFSARRSYLQFLFSAIGLPFLPTYNDFQLKTRTRIDEQNEITVIGIGAIDQFSLNTGLESPTPDQRYILNYVPVNTQWNYTNGIVYKHFRDNSFDTWVLSRNMLNNRQFKYRDNDEDDMKLLDYTSQESENKLRYEHDRRLSNGMKLNVGGGLEYARYTNQTYRAAFINNEFTPIDYDSKLNLFKWSVFGQVSQDFFEERLNLSLGLRADANSYSSNMSNMLNQLSPRISGSYQIKPDIFANFNAGRYYQQPPYTMLGFATSDGTLVNKENNLKYIRADHLVGGFEWIPTENSRVTLEGFYKWYSNYPFSLTDSISMASKGADFGTFGDEAVTSTAKGRAYGMELLYRSRDVFGFNTILAYTLVWSESENTIPTLEDDYIPTAWDNRHIFTLTSTRSFSKGWDFGFKWRYVGGSPYTPWDLETSSIIQAWDAQGRGYLDYSRFNTLRLGAFHQLDVRVDKMFYLDKWTLNFYVDVQNLYNFEGDQPDNIIVAVDDDGNRIVEDGRYLLEEIPGAGAGTVLPTVGIIVEF
ncbi:MAG: TonB-dependent receptor [Bacteroidales bacterium]